LGEGEGLLAARVVEVPSNADAPSVGDQVESVDELIIAVEASEVEAVDEVLMIEVAESRVEPMVNRLMALLPVQQLRL